MTNAIQFQGNAILFSGGGIAFDPDCCCLPTLTCVACPPNNLAPEKIVVELSAFENTQFWQGSVLNGTYVLDWTTSGGIACHSGAQCKWGNPLPDIPHMSNPDVFLAPNYMCAALFRQAVDEIDNTYLSIGISLDGYSTWWFPYATWPGFLLNSCTDFDVTSSFPSGDLHYAANGAKTARAYPWTP